MLFFELFINDFTEARKLFLYTGILAELQEPESHAVFFNGSEYPVGYCTVSLNSKSVSFRVGILLAVLLLAVLLLAVLLLAVLLFVFFSIIVLFLSSHGSATLVLGYHGAYIYRGRSKGRFPIPWVLQS